MRNIALKKYGKQQIFTYDCHLFKMTTNSVVFPNKPILSPYATAGC